MSLDKFFSRKIKSTPLILAIALLFLSLIPLGSAVTISYDDSSMDKELIGSSGAFAVRMTPERTGELKALRAYVNRPRGFFTGFAIAYGMDEHKNVVTQRLMRASDDDFTWDVRNFFYRPEYSSDFYVGINKLTRTGLGADQTQPVDRSEFSEEYDNPNGYSVDGLNNYMLRAEFDYYPTVSGLGIEPEKTNHDPAIEATCTEYETRVKAAYYRVDDSDLIGLEATDGSFDELVEEVSGTIQVNGLQDGLHAVEVVCVDDSGNQTKPPTTTSFFVDKVPPETDFETLPESPNGENNWFIGDVEITLSASDSEPSSGISEIVYTLRGATEQDPLSCGRNPCVFTLSNNGTTFVDFYAFDEAGNQESQKTKQVMIDKNPPTTPELFPFPDPHFINGTTFSFGWEESVDNESGLDYYNVYRKVNGGEFYLHDSSSVPWYTDGGLENQNTYYYHVIGVDFAGNQSLASNTDSITVDMNTDAPFLWPLPPFTASTTVNLTWDKVNDHNGIGIDYYTVYKNSVAVAQVDYTGEEQQSYPDEGNLDTETHRYNVTATDLLGNESLFSNTETTTIDITPPVTSAVPDPENPNGNNGWYITQVSVTLEATDPNEQASGVRDTYYCVDQSDACEPDTRYTGSPVIVSENGYNYVRFYSVDNAGNPEQAKSLGEIKIDTTRPSEQEIALDNGAEYNTTGSVTASLFIGADNESGLDYCEINWGDDTPWENTGLENTAGPHDYTDGLQTASYRCFDYAGNQTQPPAQDHIIVDTTPPVSDITSHVALEDIIKGRTFIDGNAFDGTSGIDFVEVKIEKKEENGNGFVVLIDWTSAQGAEEWSYLWDNSDQQTTTFRLSSRATDKAGNEETIEEIEADKIRVELIENPGPGMENAYFEGETKQVILYGFLDRANWDYNVEIFDGFEGMNGETIHSFETQTDEKAYFFLALDVNDWVLGKLYSARIELENGETVYNQFISFYYATLGEEFFGFKDIMMSTYVTSYYTDEVFVPVTLALKPVSSHHYKTEYRANPNEEWRELTECSFYEKGEKTFKNGTVHLESTGLKRVQFRTVGCGEPVEENYESHEILVTHVDLADTLRAYTNIVNPVENSNMNYPWPVGSIGDNVYWTKTGIVPLISYVGTNTEPDRDKCEIWYDSADEGSFWREIGQFDIVEVEENTWVCDTLELLTTSEWNNANYEGGNYTRLQVYNDIVGQPDSFDEIHVGVDGASPSINSINPNEEGIINGIYRVFADITDDLSGIKQADFYLIEKEGEEYCYDENCHVGDGRVVWSFRGADFNEEIMMFYTDLNTLMFADGDYNFAYGAVDTTGNEAYLEIDPIIDNTPPRITSVEILPNDPKTRGTTITINAEVSDNVSGVAVVTATITKPDDSKETFALEGSEPFFSGEYQTSVLFEPGLYTLRVDATDRASNNALPIESGFNLEYSYTVDINLSSNEVTQGETITIDGILLKDDGSIVGEYEVEIDLPTETVTVIADANTGEFSFEYNTGSTPVGTHDIAARVTAPNGVESSDTEQLKINPQENPQPPGNEGGGNGGGAGGGGGSSSRLSIELGELCTNTEIPARILMPDGEPAKGAVVSLIYRNRTIDQKTTGTDGVVYFTVTETGTYLISARGSYNSSAFETIQVSECKEEEQTSITPPQEEAPEAEETNGQQLNQQNQGQAAKTGLGDTLQTQPSPTPTGLFGLGQATTNTLFLLALAIGLASMYAGWKKGFGKTKPRLSAK